jgi:hypothetical protein
MKTRFLVVIGIIVTGVITVSTIVTIEYQSTYNQNCNSDGGHVVGFLRCTYINEDFEHQSTKYDSTVLDCFQLIFHCDSESEYFEDCIGAKKDGITIEEICSSFEFVITDGCATIDFGDGNRMITCE